MGLMIYSLEEIPDVVQKDYYVYLLDYGWDEPIADILYKNYDNMVKIAMDNNAVVIKGTVASHFQNNVLSWHHINGYDAETLLPALLITNKNPHYFVTSNETFQYKKTDKIKLYENGDMKMVLIPFKTVCTTENEVITIIQSVFADIIQGDDLANFRVIRRQRRGIGQAVVDAVILQPNINGIGFDLKEFFDRD